MKQYFIRLGEIREQIDDELKALETEGDAQAQLASTDAELIEIIPSFMKEFMAVLDRGIVYIGDIDPPEKARAAHNNLVNVELAGRGLLETILNRVENIGSQSEFADMAADLDPMLEEVEERETDACLALQRLAQDNGIDVDLRCEG